MNESTPPPSQSPFSNISIQNISAGGEHTLLHTTNGQILSAGACGLNWCRGKPMLPSLYGWRRVDGFPEFIKTIHASYYHNLAIGNTGTLYSWGCGTFIDGNNDGSIPALGNGNCEDKGALPVVVTLPVGQAVAITGGAYHSVVLNDVGTVYTFGAGQLGQLGREHSMTKIETVDGAGLPIDADPKPVEGIDSEIETVTHIGASFYNTLITCKSGQTFCSGENQNLQCGVANGQQNIHCMEKIQELTEVAVIKGTGGYCSNIFLDNVGEVFTMGCGDDGNRGDGKKEEEYEMNGETRPVVNKVELPCKATDIAAGANHSLVLGEDGDVYGFGSNEYGQLGIESQNNELGENDDDEEDADDCIVTPTRMILPSNIGKIVGISAGYAHSTIIDENGIVLVLGQNENGQLGLGLNGVNVAYLRIPTKIFQ
tara:strand:+ start:637 stop:1917 length:1281 start_codon:yes stop_codon:yes gene_type:complete